MSLQPVVMDVDVDVDADADADAENTTCVSTARL
jgi:hypothetical protein